jgi:tetratricopeptide (TPR) repeat protein
MMRRTGSVSRASLPVAMADRFDLMRQVGSGANSAVFHARDHRLGRDVAVKVFEPDAGAAGAAERQEREISLASRLLHPMIVPVLDHGVLEGYRFYVMSFVSGETLRATMARGGARGVDEVVRIGLDLCEALAAAHAAGVIHRDVKPENIFDAPDRSLLADFGIATAMGTSAAMRLTESGIVHGTGMYMSPEQAMARRDLDGRCDLYALGCVLWELLAGRPPFVHPNIMQLVAMHVQTPLPPLEVDAAVVPRTLVTLVRALLEKDRDARPASATEAHARLLEVRAQASARVQIPTATPTPRGVEAITPSMMAYRHGRTLLLRGQAGGAGAAEALNVARTYFERALALDPENDVARLGLAEGIRALGDIGAADAQRATRESQAIRRSTFERAELGAEACAMLGETLLYWEDDLSGAGRMFARALAVDPSQPHALCLHGRWLAIMGRLEEAAVHLRGAHRLLPHDIEIAIALGDTLMQQGRCVDALGIFRSAQRLHARHPVLLDRIVRTAHRTGFAAEAAASRRVALREAGQKERLAMFEEELRQHGWTHAREADLARELDGLFQRARREDPFHPRGTARQLSDELLVTLADLGAWTEAMDCVEEGARRRPTRVRQVLTDLPLDRRGLAADPRYAPLLMRTGLEELL